MSCGRPNYEPHLDLRLDGTMRSQRKLELSILGAYGEKNGAFMTRAEYNMPTTTVIGRKIIWTKYTLSVDEHLDQRARTVKALSAT